MISDWREVKLEDVVESINTGLDAIRRAPIVSYPTPIKCLRIQDVSQNKSISNWGFTEVKDSDYQNYKLRKGEIIMARTCSTGINYLVKKDLNAVFNNGLARLRVKKGLIDPKFLFYRFRSSSFINYINAISGGTSVQLNMKVGDLAKYEFDLPPIKIQKAIAHILGTFDEKIELNTRTNETLEGIAKALFKSWFIDFDPVRAKAEGRKTLLPDEISKLFPNSFEDSELGETPSGWKLGNIDQIALNPKEKAKPFEMNSSDRYIGLEHMPRKSIALTDSSTAENLASNKNVFKKGDILYGKLRPYFKKTGFAQFDGVCSTDIVVVREKFKLCRGFICFLLASNPFIDFTVALSSGTRMPRTSWNQMCEFLLPIPQLPLVQIFGEIVSPMMDKIRINSEQSISLSSVRDALLPKLISGQLKIPDAEKMLEEVGI